MEQVPDKKDIECSTSISAEGKKEFKTSSGIPLKRVYTSEDLSNWDEKKALSLPAEYPYTRGVYPTMYRGQIWTKRLLMGHQTPEVWNKRQKELIRGGQTGINFIPCCNTFFRGYDSDEVDKELVGTCGTTIDSLQDVEICYDGIHLDQVTSALNDPNPCTMLAMYCGLAERQGIPLWKLQGTCNQTDSISHWIACQQMIRFPLEGHLRCLVDLAKFCTENMPRWHPLSVVGQHMGEGGATPVQELGFALSSALFYVSEFIKAGLDVDSFAPRISFFFNVRSDFFEEVAKFRACRRMWANIMKERFGATKSESWRCRFHVQTTGVELSQKQPINNIARSSLQTLAAVFSGAQSIHTDSYDEALWTPTPESQRIALMTQNIIAEETGVTGVVDPLGGSYFIESLTDAVEEKAWDIIKTVDQMGGMLEAVRKGYPQNEIGKSAIERQKKIDSGERTWVGVNKYTAPEGEERWPPQVKVDPEAIDRQIERTRRLRKERNQQEAGEALRMLYYVTESSQGNIFEAMVGAFKANCTHGEVIGELRKVFSFGRPPTIY